MGKPESAVYDERLQAVRELCRIARRMESWLEDVQGKTLSVRFAATLKPVSNSVSNVVARMTQYCRIGEWSRL